MAGRLYSTFCSGISLRVLLAICGFLDSLFSGLHLSSGELQKPGLLLTLHSMSHGGYNFPLLPVMQHIPVIGLLLVASCVFVNTLRTRHSFGPVEYLTLLGLFMLPAAFGRSDIGHFIIDSTGMLMAAWTILSFYPHLWRYAVWSYALLVLFLPAPRILYRAERACRNNVSTVLLRPDILATKTGSPVSPSLSAAPASLFAPFGLPLANSPKLPSISAQTGFYHGIELVTAPSQIQQKIQELRSTPARDLLLPNSFSCAIRLDRKALRKTLSTLYVPPSRNGTEILEPLCRYIHQHYQPSGFPTELQGFEIWKPRPSTP